MTKSMQEQIEEEFIKKLEKICEEQFDRTDDVTPQNIAANIFNEIHFSNFFIGKWMELKKGKPTERLDNIPPSLLGSRGISYDGLQVHSKTYGIYNGIATHDLTDMEASWYAPFPPLPESKEEEQ